MANGVFMLKNMVTGEQKSVNLTELLAFLG
jgi:hypothetical protein